MPDHAPASPPLHTALARLLLRSAAYPAVAAWCMFDFLRSGDDLRSRVQCLQRVARRHARIMELRIRIHGPVPASGLVVANHVSYFDIIALSAAGACTFVSKKEVARWPLFGWFARKGGTIFVDRERRGAVASVIEEMHAPIDAGIPLVLFPEGTSTDGSHLLPFRSSLFEPVIALRCPVTACGLRYSISDGTVAHDVAYWGEMELAPQLARMLTKSGVTLDVHFGSSQTPAHDRKAAAKHFEQEVRTLAGLVVGQASSLS